MRTITEHTPVATILEVDGARELLVAICPTASAADLNAELRKFPVGIFLTLHLGADEPAIGEVLDALAAFEDHSPRLQRGPDILPSPDYEGPDVPRGSATVGISPLGGRRGPLRAREGVEFLLLGPSHGNPFVDVEVTVTFTRLDGDGADQPIRVGGFYDGVDGSGRGRHLVRFVPPSPGQWEWSTSSNARSLDALAGTVTVEEANTPGLVTAHGTRFAHEDGTPFPIFGTTAYAWLAQPRELQERTLATLAAAPFNKLRMCLTPKHYSYNRDEPEHLPFERTACGWDPTRFDLAFWRNVDVRITQLGRIGVQADVIFFHSYDRWGFASMPAEVDERYLRYAVRRLAAHPNVWWSMANEYDLLTHKSREDWETQSRLVAEEDHAGHLIGVHNIFDVYEPTSPWITHVSFQGGGHTIHEAADSLRRRFGKPVAIDEFGYEGDIEFNWGNLTAHEMVRRFWSGTLAGAHLTHGETYHRGDEVLWWSKGGELHGHSPARIAFLRRMVEESPTGFVEPLRRGFDVVAAGVEDEYILEYFGDAQPRQRTCDLPPGAWEVDVVDTWEMTVTPLAGVHRERLVVPLPARPWMALRARRMGD